MPMFLLRIDDLLFGTIEVFRQIFQKHGKIYLFGVVHLHVFTKSNSVNLLRAKNAIKLLTVLTKTA